MKLVTDQDIVQELRPTQLLLVRESLILPEGELPGVEEPPLPGLVPMTKRLPRWPRFKALIVQSVRLPQEVCRRGRSWGTVVMA